MGIPCLSRMRAKKDSFSELSGSCARSRGSVTVASGVRRQILILSFAGNAEAIALLAKAESEARASAPNIKLIELSRCSCATSTPQALS